MPDFTRFAAYVARLTQDIYEQPPDPGHIAWGKDAIYEMAEQIGDSVVRTVLDVGCGQAPFQQTFTTLPLHMEWTGVTIGADYQAAKMLRTKPDVREADFTFLPFEDNKFDMVFARHALEHSPFPLITLMEWWRVAKKYLMLVAPAPAYWGVRGRNHYAVLYEDQLHWLLLRSGWGAPVYEHNFVTDHPVFRATWEANKRAGEDGPRPEGVIVEYRYLCKKAGEVEA